MFMDLMDQRTLWSLDTKKIFQDRLDFASPTKSEFKEVIPRHYTVLTPDRLRGSSSVDSPCTSNGDLLTSRGSSSCSTGSSPISITKELTSVASPLTPLPHTPNSRSKSPLQDHAKVFLAVEKSSVIDCTNKVHCRSYDKDRDRDMERDHPSERRRERFRRSPVPSRSPPSRDRRKKDRRHRSRSSSPPRAKKLRVSSPLRRTRGRSRSPKRKVDKDRSFNVSQYANVIPTSGKSETCSSHESLCNGTVYSDYDSSQHRDIETKKELGNIFNIAHEKKRDNLDSSMKDDLLNSTKTTKLLKEEDRILGNGNIANDNDKNIHNGWLSKCQSVHNGDGVFSTMPLIKQKKLTINIGVETVIKKKPLVEYTETDGSSDDEDQKPSTSQCISNGTTSPVTPNTARTIIGPLLPCKEEIEKPSMLEEKRSNLSDDLPSIKRKRLLSERGEKELVYPVMDKTTISIWNWKGCETIRGRIRGTGLVNTSNDCFLNVILQMVAHTAPLARYIWEKHPQEKCFRPQGQCLSCAMKHQHLKRVFSGQGPFVPSWIRPFMRKIFPSHIHGMQEDAHELLSLLLDAVDPPVGYNKQNGALPSGVSSKPSTPIEQIFGGTLRNQITCNICKTSYINYERIRELNLAIRKRSDGDNIKISHLIEIYFRDENVSNFDCKKCARKTLATRRTRVLRPPAVLLVQLKRFNAFGGKIRLPVTADLDVDLMKHMYDLESNQYVLTGVVEHLGAGVDHGHYISYARGFDSQSWYLFDDEIVTAVSSQKVVGSNPYLLVYSRREHLGMAPKNTACVKTSNNPIRPNGVLKNNGAEQLNKSFTSMVNNGFSSQKKFLSPTSSPYKKTSYRPNFI